MNLLWGVRNVSSSVFYGGYLTHLISRGASFQSSGKLKPGEGQVTHGTVRSFGSRLGTTSALKWPARFFIVR